MYSPCLYLFFFFNDTATTEIYTLSLHDALPISSGCAAYPPRRRRSSRSRDRNATRNAAPLSRDRDRSEEHTSELQSPDHLVCRLLLEKKKNNTMENRRTYSKVTQGQTRINIQTG